MAIKYFKIYLEKDAKAFEVTKEEARKTLDGHWKKECLDEIFEKEQGFRLHTPFAIVWTNRDGAVPMAGFFGTVG